MTADPAGGPRADRLTVVPDPDGFDPVLLAAREVIMTHGPRRATLAEVARQAGVSRMTVYRRFDSFDRMAAALLTVELSAELRRIDTLCPTDRSVRDQVVFMVGALTRAIADHPLVQRVLAVDPESMVPLMVQRFGQTQRTAAQVLAPRLAEGMASRGGDGSIREGDPEAMAQVVVTAAQSFVFAAQAIGAHPKGEAVRAEWSVMVDGYLAPGRDERE